MEEMVPVRSKHKMPMNKKLRSFTCVVGRLAFVMKVAYSGRMAETRPSDHRLDLSRTDRLARGKVRDVFARPGHPEQLLKTLRETKRTAYARRRGLIALIKRHIGLGPYRYLLKEYRCYLRVALRAERLDRPIPIAEFGPVIRTDRGLAQVSRRVPDRSGALAPTLRELLRAGPLDPVLLKQLNAFVGDLYDLNVVVPDLTAGNVVLDESVPDGRFLLIDGYGEKAFITLQTYFPALNARALDRGFARIASGSVLRWNGSDRRFERQ